MFDTYQFTASDRFMRYVQVDTQSDPLSATYPTTEKQKDLSKILVEELKQILGRARAKKGMFEGDLAEGELEIGQGSSLVREILPASQIVKLLWDEVMDGLADPVKRL